LLFSAMFTSRPFATTDCTHQHRSATSVSQRPPRVGSENRTGTSQRPHKLKQVAQLSLTNRPTLVHADVPCCAVKSCPLVNDCDSLAGYSNFSNPSSVRRPRSGKFPQSFGHNTSTRLTRTDRQPHRHNKCQRTASGGK